MEVYRVKTGSILPLGKQGENLVRKIQFDLSRWISNFGPGTVQLLHQRSGDEAPYPVAVEQEGNLAVWTVTNADTAAAGTGRAELQYYVGDALAKSETWMTKVLPALGPASETPPEAQQGWVDQVLQAGAAATEAAEKAVNAAVRQPIVGGNGNWWTWDLEAGAYVDTGIYSGGDAPYIGDNGNWYVGQTDTGVAATGPQGLQGEQGPAGPALAVTNTAAVGQTIRVSAVDENGQPTEWEAVDMASGGGSGKAKTQKLIDITFTEPTASLSVTLEHNFHKLFLVWSCGKGGVARTVDTDGNAVSGDLCVLLDTTSVGYNERKIGQIAGNTYTWKNTSLRMEWSDDMSTFINAMTFDIDAGKKGSISQCFGGSLAMAGTLSKTALAPTVGKTVNIVASGGFFAATTRIVLVGEYYE